MPASSLPRIGLAQMQVRSGRPDRNVARMLEMIAEAREAELDLVAFPELCVCGYLLGDAWEVDALVRDFESWNEVLRSASEGITLVYGNVALDPGRTGEDGSLQGLLEHLGPPYAGAGVAASAVGMDKALQKALFTEAGIPVARYVVLHGHEIARDGERARRFVEDEIGYPCFIKPANGGSSIGITRAASREDLGGAFAAAQRHDAKILAERALDGREIECAVLGNETPEAAAVVGEIAPDRAFYDYESKYAADSRTALHVPARIDGEAAARVPDCAERMYRTIGCEGYARVDFFVDADGAVAGSEVNTIPGFTSISMFPKLWEASGLAYPDLLTRILDLALARREREAAR